MKKKIKHVERYVSRYWYTLHSVCMRMTLSDERDGLLVDLKRSPMRDYFIKIIFMAGDDQIVDYKHKTQ